ncbi:MAG TPA: calcium/proton exchanger [Candidatus Limnocylindria bacterium]
MPRLPATITVEQRVMLVLLLFVPATFLAEALGAGQAIRFFLSVAAVIPLAAFIGEATDALAARLGGKVGGLLNATFGNAPDLLIGVFGLQRGLVPLVKATLIGALISNSALVMGLCCVVAGLAHGRPRFDRREAGHHSVLMMLTVAAFLFPSATAAVLCGGACTQAANETPLIEASVGVSVVLLLAYVAYVVYGIFGLERLRGAVTEGRETRAMRSKPETHAWPAWLAVGVLVGATAVLVPVIDVLTAGVTAATDALGWSQVFVGVVIVANAGNVAEGYAAIKFAIQKPGLPERSPSGDSGIDLGLAIASASSIQIATFVTPLIVLYGLASHPMDLVFTVVEMTILALLVLIFTFIAQDGETNWLEGVELLALYVMAAIMFFVLPAAAFGG